MNMWKDAELTSTRYGARLTGRPEVENGTAEEESQPLVPWIFLKIRIVLAVLLMLAFLLLKYNAYEFHGYQAKDVIDIISDNQYYTILQDYVMINEHD